MSTGQASPAPPSQPQLPLSPPGEPGLTCLTGCCTCLSRAAPMDIGTLKDVHTLEDALVLRYLGLEWVTLTGVALTRGSWQPVPSTSGTMWIHPGVGCQLAHYPPPHRTVLLTAPQLAHSLSDRLLLWARVAARRPLLHTTHGCALTDSPPLAPSRGGIEAQTYTAHGACLALAYA